MWWARGPISFPQKIWSVSCIPSKKWISSSQISNYFPHSSNSSSIRYLIPYIVFCANQRDQSFSRVGLNRILLCDFPLDQHKTPACLTPPALHDRQWVLAHHQHANPCQSVLLSPLAEQGGEGQKTAQRAWYKLALLRVLCETGQPVRDARGSSGHLHASHQHAQVPPPALRKAYHGTYHYLFAIEEIAHTLPSLRVNCRGENITRYLHVYHIHLFIY